MHSYKQLKLLIIILIVGLTGKVSAQTVDDIVAKHITAMGGADKLSKLKSLKISANMEVMNMEMPVTTTIVQDKGFRTETTAQGMTIIQVVDGNKGWMINPMTGQTKATALPEEVVKSLSSQSDLTGLYNYKEKGYTLSLDGEEDLAGAKVYKITMTKNGVKQENYISKDTFYVLKIVATVALDGQNVKTENVQSNFKQIEGITFPFSSEVTTSAMPGMAMVNKIAAVEVNPKIDDSIFAMPN
jgi:outer membrane lipoprotein-sorting protein